MLLVQLKRTVPLCQRVKFNCGATPPGGKVFCRSYGVHNNNNELQYNYNYIYRKHYKIFEIL